MRSDPELKIVKDPTLRKMFLKYPVYCGTLIALDILDVVTTATFLSLGASEGNPIFAILFNQGMFGFAMFVKFVFLFNAMYLSYILAESSLKIGKFDFFKETGMMCFFVGISLTAFIVSMSLFTIHDCLIGGVMCV